MTVDIGERGEQKPVVRGPERQARVKEQLLKKFAEEAFSENAFEADEVLKKFLTRDVLAWGNQLLAEDAAALLRFKDSGDPSAWPTAVEGWPSDASVCEWAGVSCAGSRVTGLDFGYSSSGRGLTYGYKTWLSGDVGLLAGATALEEIDRLEAVGTPRGVHRGDELGHPARVLGSRYGPEPLAALDDADLVRVRVGDVGGFGGALARERDERDGRRGTGLDDGAGLRGESADAAAMGVMLDHLPGLSS